MLFAGHLIAIFLLLILLTDLVLLLQQQRNIQLMGQRHQPFCNQLTKDIFPPQT